MVTLTLALSTSRSNCDNLALSSSVVSCFENYVQARLEFTLVVSMVGSTYKTLTNQQFPMLTETINLNSTKSSSNETAVLSEATKVNAHTQILMTPY